MSTQTLTPPHLSAPPHVDNALADAVREGLGTEQKWLPAWLFYDNEGSRLFECITELPEYYLTRTERAIFAEHADEILTAACRLGSGPLRILELGAGSASKTGILLAAACRMQGAVEYLPIDVSEGAMAEACEGIERTLPGVTVCPQVANYVTDALTIPPHDGPTLALYIGSSIGNFSQDEAIAVLRNLRAQMCPGDSLLLGTDLVKAQRTLLAAYNDREGVTAEFNLNLLHRLNRELAANFQLGAFEHQAIWNAGASRIEMHLRSLHAQTVAICAAGIEVHFEAGETIHTENSYKFTPQTVAQLLLASGFATTRAWTDDAGLFAVTLAAAD